MEFFYINGFSRIPIFIHTTPRSLREDPGDKYTYSSNQLLAVDDSYATAYETGFNDTGTIGAGFPARPVGVRIASGVSSLKL